MNNELLTKIDNLIDGSRQELADLTVKLVNIKSDLQPAAPGAPFGEGVRKVLDTVVEMGKQEGFFTTDYNVGVISVAMKNSSPDLGIWTHGDVVTAGNDWEFEPYNAVEYQGRIIGRGAADNKGQLAAIFTLLKIFKKLGIELKYNTALYVGSNEESGMQDLLGVEGNDDARGFINVCTPPKMSLVPDGGFPVGYGGKGGLNLKLKSRSPLHNCSLVAGQNDAPGKACAVFKTNNLPDTLTECTVRKVRTTTVEAFSPPVHNAHPNPEGNMITKLSTALLDTNVLDNSDRQIFDFLAKVSKDTTGSMFGIDIETQTMSPLTLSAHRIDDTNGCPELYINIRYPIEITLEKIIDNITKTADKYGFILTSYTPKAKPYLLNKDTEIIFTLCDIANSVTANKKQPYTLGGATYAHVLPNAYVYGSSANLPPENWQPGRGGAHGIDEAVSLDRLQRAMKIYSRALLSLNDMKW